MRKQIVFVDFPKAGLGNRLLVWSRARIFSHLNNLPMVTATWYDIHWGAWWRGEKKKRTYWGYFHESSLRQRLGLLLLKLLSSVVIDPEAKRYQLPDGPHLYCFKNIVVENDLFRQIRPFRLLIKAEITALLKPAWREKLAREHNPVIAIHVRRGDFKIANPVTPNSFFINAITFIRKTTGRQWPVTVFTDAGEEEITEILHLNNVHLAAPNPDILDILIMAKSKVIVISQSSTFSYWSAFLSDAIVIKPEGDWQGDLRSPEVNKEKFEGKVNFDLPETLNRLEANLVKAFSIEK